MGSGKTSTTTQSVQIPPEVMARYRSVNARAENTANTPFQQYSTNPEAFVAPFNQTQQAGTNMMMNAPGYALPFYGDAAAYTQAGAQGVGPLTQQQIGYYQDPYTNYVAGTTYEALRQQQQQEMQGATANAIKSGAFGGDRAGLVAANLARQQQLGTSQALAPILSQGYQFGAQTAAGQQGVAAADLNRLMQAGGQYANLGSGLSNIMMQSGQGVLGAGTAQQQTDQAGLSALYNQFQQERAYPFQVAQFLANIAMGTGALSGSTTTTTQPAPFFSDERLKDDIEPIGELNDGQTVYRYDMNGRKQIGLLAQEVEQKEPEAVGLARGFKTVDYNKATENSSEGRRGFNNGGSAFDPNVIQQLLQTQQGMYSGMYGQPGTPRGAQGSPGVAGYVPAATLPVGKLATAGALPQQPQSGLGQAAQTAGNIRSLVDLAGAAKDKMMAGYNAITGGNERAGVAGPMNLVPRSNSMDTNQIGAGSVGVAPRASAEVPIPPPRPQELAEIPGTLEEFETIAFARHGGRINRAAGGTIPYEADGFFPEEILEQENKPELAKPGQVPQQQGSGVMDALKLGTSLYSAGTTLAPAISSAASALLAILPFSDERLKNNSRRVGKTYDGQNIYAYEMGDGRTRIGLMAQEVEEKMPEAVGLAAGFKTLDAERATDRAAGLGRRERASGGAAEEFPEEEWKRMIRQESGGKQFDRKGSPLRSPKGAVGIAQVMPGTAPEAARYAGVEFDNERYQNDPEYNEKLGRAYYKEQYRRFGDPLVAAAAYNAGPGRVEKAIARAESEGGSYLNYLPTETRNYVAAVSGAAKKAISVAMNERGSEGQSQNSPVPGVAGPGRGPTDAASAPFTYLTQGMFKDSDPQMKAALTSENFWVPLVTGVGTMLASRSPWLGNAVGEGLVGGVQAYKDIQKQQQELGASRAQTEATMSQVAGEAIKYIGDRLFVRYIRPDGKYDYIAYNEWLALPEGRRPKLDPRASEIVQDLSKSEEGPKPSPAAPPPASSQPAEPKEPLEPVPPMPASGISPQEPSAKATGEPVSGPAAVPPPRPSPFVLSPEQASEAADTARRKAGWATARVNAEPDLFTDQDMLAKSVADQKQLIVPLAGTLAALPRDKSISVSGKAQEVLYPVMSWLNNLAAIAGKPDLIQDPSVLAKQNEVVKLTNQLQQIATTNAQQKAFAAFKEMAEGVPGLLTSPGGQSKLIAQMLTNAQMIADKNEFFANWAKAAGGDRGQFSEFAKATSREANREFDRKFTNAFYAQERAKLEQMFNDTVKVEGKDVPVLQIVAMRPELLTPKRKAQIEREYGTGILRYFGIN